MFQSTNKIALNRIPANKIALKFLKKGLLSVSVLMSEILLPNTLLNISPNTIEVYGKSKRFWKRTHRFL